MKSHQAFRIDEFDYLSVDGHDLRARLYRPAGDGGDWPGLIDIHGGRWVANDRYANARIVEPLAASGIAVLSIDFRVPPAATYPGPVCDIHYAIRWFKANAANFGIREDTIGGLGTSSGGHQMLLAAMKPGTEPYGSHSFAPGVDARLKYMIAGWPVIDPPVRYEFAKETGRDNIVEAHHAYWVPMSLMEEGSPQGLLDSGTAEDLPPLLIIQGSADKNFDYRTVEKFCADYRNAGGDSDIVIYEGAQHSFMNRDAGMPDALDALERMTTFINRRAR